MSRIILHNQEVRTKLLRGVETLAKAVGVTLGPKGRNVILDQDYGAPHVTKDGVSVAKKVKVNDPVEDIGVRLAQEVASKTNDTVGDGTTTATVLAYSIVKGGMKNVAAGANPMDLKRGMEKAVAAAVENLEAQAQPVEHNDQIEQIATISANGEKEIGQMIAQAFSKVGKEGVITVEEAQSVTTEVEVVEGMQFDRGFRSSFFATDLKKMVTELEDAYILLAEEKITTSEAILPILRKIYETGNSKPLAVIADDVEGEALTTLLLNRVHKGLKVVAIKAPGFGDRKKEMLQDIAILTGGTVISPELGEMVKDADISHLGNAKKVTVDKDKTLIVGGTGESSQIKNRVTQIRSQIGETSSDYDREKLEERLAKLSSGVAVLRVGAATETAMKEKKDRVEDALNATKAAVQEGIVAGGGVALLRTIDAVLKVKDSLENLDQKTGVDIIAKALEAPTRLIVENAGGEGSIVVEKIKMQSGDYGYNANTNTYEALYKAGVVDPKKVIRLALENATSIGSMMLTTECVIAKEKEKEETSTGAGAMGNGMGGMM